MIDDDDIDAIISELNASGGAAPARSNEARGQLEALLEDVVAPPRQRFAARRRQSARRSAIDGAVERLSGAIVDGLDIEEARAAGCCRTARGKQFHGTRRRRRVNPSAGAGPVPRQPAPRTWTRGGGHPRAADAGAAARRAVAAAGDRAAVDGCRAGWCIVGGATGAGKTTTIAALVDEINRRDPRHIITVEDPIEYEHAHDRSIVEQVEIGADAPDFPTALRSAVRQAPDVLVIGEMRDPNRCASRCRPPKPGTWSSAACTPPTSRRRSARICDSFPNERQNTIRQELAFALAAVMTQTLIPKIGGGRIPAAELLMVSYGARQHIRKNALQHLHQEMSITRKQGSLTLEDSLGRLVKGGQISLADAQARAGHPDEFESVLRK